MTERCFVFSYLALISLPALPLCPRLLQGPTPVHFSRSETLKELILLETSRVFFSNTPALAFSLRTGLFRRPRGYLRPTTIGDVRSSVLLSKGQWIRSDFRFSSSDKEPFCFDCLLRGEKPPPTPRHPTPTVFIFFLSFL